MKAQLMAFLLFQFPFLEDFLLRELPETKMPNKIATSSIMRGSNLVDYFKYINAAQRYHN